MIPLNHLKAARTGDFETMKKLVEEGANVNDKVCGCTALMYAAFYGREEMTEYLLQLGANINECNLSGQTALLWAVERQHFSIVKILLRHHAEVNICDKKGLSGTVSR
jgi:ankyrin repeat protein